MDKIEKNYLLIFFSVLIITVPFWLPGIIENDGFSRLIIGGILLLICGSISIFLFVIAMRNLTNLKNKNNIKDN